MVWRLRVEPRLNPTVILDDAWWKRDRLAALPPAQFWQARPGNRKGGLRALWGARLSTSFACIHFYLRFDFALSYQQPAGLTGMRAGLPWRLRAKSIRYQRPDNRPTSQEFGPLVSGSTNGLGIETTTADTYDSRSHGRRSSIDGSPHAKRLCRDSTPPLSAVVTEWLGRYRAWLGSVRI